MPAAMLVARLVHIVCGAYWVGAVLFIGLFLGPSTAAVGPAALGVMSELLRRKYYEFTVIMATLSIIAGAFLVWQDSAHFDPAWFASPFGRGISIGMLAALIAYGIGTIMVRPLVYRLSALGAQMAAGADPVMAAEFVQTRDRLIGSSKMTVALLVIAVSAMAVARYL
jgi:hypothetical protein